MADVRFKIEVKMDNRGRIIGVSLPSDEMEQSVSYDQKPSLDDALAHYGVKGMKWGVRRQRDGGSGGSSSTGPKRVSSADIKRARENVQAQQERYNQANRARRQAKRAGDTKGEAQAKKQMKDINASFLKDPDRATQLRLTKGEKAVSAALFLIPGGGVPVAAGVGARVAVRKAVEADIARRNRG